MLIGAAWGAFGTASRVTARSAAPVRITGPAAPTASPGVRPSIITPRPPTHTAPTKATDAQPAGQPVTFVTLHWGDTLFALARSHHTTVSALQQLNGLGTSTLIYAGHRLRVLAPTVSGTRPAPTVPGAYHAPTGARLHTRPVLTATSPGPVTSTHHRGAAAAIAFAKAQLGKPYQWGGTGPSGFDCSGLIMRAWQAGGITLPRGTHDQSHIGTRIHRAALQPGDLVFTNGFGHVQMYLGDAIVIQAPHPGAVVSTAPLPPDRAVDAYTHLDAAT